MKTTRWMLPIFTLMLATACATQAPCDCERPPPNTLSPKEVKAFERDAASPEVTKTTTKKAQNMRHGGAIALTEGAKLEDHLGQRVIVVGQAGNAKLGAIVDGPHGVIYLVGMRAWTGAGVLGEQVEVSGVLERYDTSARKGADGLISQGTSGPSWWLRDPSYHLLTVDTID